MKNSLLLKISLLLILLVGFSLTGLAQCPMCRSAVESAMQNEGNKIGLGLNSGIIYLLSAPYALVLGMLGYWFYNKRKK